MRFETSDLLVPDLSLLGWRREADESVPGLAAHQHEEAVEVCLVRHGRLRWWIGSDTWELEPGDIFFTPAGAPHGAVDTAVGPGEFFWLQLPVDAPDGAKLDPALRKAVADLGSRRFAASAATVTAWEQLIDEHLAGGDRPHATEAASGALKMLMVGLLRDHQAARERAVPTPALEKARRRLEQRLDEDVPIPELARAAGVTPNYLHRLFHDHIGETPVRYRQRRRIDRARRLLQTTDRSITDIALSIGFGSSQYFATVFRRFTGTSPTQYRRRVQAE
ncbi:MAG: AraC family transcriptional regulator [Phycisphaeraceae bacterium]|nr:AraC family transcriptional regulator [Phycisphaeraceae bacterium]